MKKTYWFAVETRARAEYVALADINAMDGLEAYVPQETRLRRTRKGRVVVQHPLIPSFIFVGSKTPPIVDASSPDHPHPIFQVLASRAVRALLRSPGGGVHPIRPRYVDGWPVDFVEDLRANEAAGAFDFTPRPKPEAGPKRFQKGDLKELMAFAKNTLFPDREIAALAA
jgi:hypothetical protein